MGKLRNKPVDIYKSRLEKVASNLLTEAGLWFEYEPWEVVLIDSFVFDLPSYEKVGKVFKKQSSKIRKNFYKPDFVGTWWVMETKGLRTPDFNIKWKLFKRYLIENNLNYTLFMPTNKKQIQECIETILEHDRNSGPDQQRPHKNLGGSTTREERKAKSSRRGKPKSRRKNTAN